MNYEQTLEYLYAQLPMFQRVGAAAYKADLNNTHAMCEILGHPERQFLSIHVAGTNGKGSVSHMLASVLQEAGYKTGLFTSPHLKDFRERIKINGQMIPQSVIIDFVSHNIDRFINIKPSFFEYTFALGIKHFADEHVDIAIMETGMGGRLDSTNVITPVVSVITNISKDHTRFLGDSIQSIAREKAGIIKPGVPVVIGERQEDIHEVFMETAITNNSAIVFADQQFNYQKSGNSNQLIVDIEPVDESLGIEPFRNIFCPLSGFYQVKNIITVLAVLQQLGERFPFNRGHLYNGLARVVQNTGLYGRWQTLSEKPWVICDTAHNVEGIKSVVSQLNQVNYRQLHFVMGMVNDKSTEDILELLPKNASYYFCKADIPRGMDQDELKHLAEKQKLQGQSYPSVIQALQAAKEIAQQDDLIFVGGSTFVVAEIL